MLQEDGRWRQLTLDIHWDEAADFDALVPGPNGEAVTAVYHASTRPGPPIVLYGEEGTGKSHLLQAACRRAGEAGLTAAYIALRDPACRRPELLEGLENLSVVALDDLEWLAGRPDWEVPVFHLFNRLRDAGAQLFAAAADRPDRLGLALPDLASRLHWGLVFRLQALSDDDRMEVLQRRARSRGLELPAETARYLLVRCPRRMPYLLGLLERLDAASLRTGRRLTIPFLRTVLDEEG